MAIIAVLAISGIKAQTAEKTTNKTETEITEVYYFHNTRRCATCEAVESVTKKALEESFSSELENGTLIFTSLDIEDDANEPTTRKYKVSGQTLLIVKNGKQKNLTNDAFMYARSNPEKLKTKIRDAINKL